MRRIVVVLLVVLALTASGYDRAIRTQVRGSDPVATAPADTSHLQPALQRALDRAIAAAAAAGVELHLTSGWRSAAEQQRLFDAAVRKYGSPAEASHWVLPPSQSAHVQGAAVDVGPRSGAKWLERYGVQFGLCRRYDNEWWHFELLAAANGGTCPARAAHAGSTGSAD